MRYAPQPLVDLLRNNTRLPFADCYTIVTQYGADIGNLVARALGNPVGQTYFYTSSDADVQIGNHLYSSRGLIVKGIKYKLKKGLEVDEQSVTIHSDASVKTAEGVPFLQAIGEGLLDGARFKQERAFFDPATWPARPGVPNRAIGSIVLFSGAVNTVDEVGRTTASMKVRSDLSLLDIDMPRNLWQPSCLHTLFDAGCGLKRELFTAGGVVTSTSTAKVINWTNTGGASYYAQGVVRFTSGANIGISRPVQASDNTGFSTAFPFPFVPAVGDAFQITPGCDHTLATCKAKFMNDRNFRGYPYVPPPETAI